VLGRADNFNNTELNTTATTTTTAAASRSFVWEAAERKTGPDVAGCWRAAGGLLAALLAGCWRRWRRCWRWLHVLLFSSARGTFDDLKTGDPDVNKTKVFLWSASP